MSLKHNAYRNNRKHTQHKLNSLPKSTFMSTKIQSDIKICTELTPTTRAKIMTITPNWEVTCLLRDIALTFLLPSMVCLFVTHVVSGSHFDSLRSWEKEESQRGTNVYLQTRLSLVTSNMKKNLEISLKKSGFLDPRKIGRWSKVNLPSHTAMVG